MAQKVVIAGSRTIDDYSALVDAIANCQKLGFIRKEFIVLSGGAYGVDKLAQRYAKEQRLICVEYQPMYDSSTGFGSDFNRRAPLQRNLKMAQDGDLVLALWDGVSTGTKHMINSIVKLGKVAYYVLPPNDNIHIVKQPLL